MLWTKAYRSKVKQNNSKVLADDYIKKNIARRVKLSQRDITIDMIQLERAKLQLLRVMKIIKENM